jgi:hypothetical protein
MQGNEPTTKREESEMETPTITIDTDKDCSRCGKLGACNNGLCLECISKRIGTVKTESRLCEYKFSEAEKREIAADLANGVAELQRLEGRKKSLASQIKSEVDGKQAAVNLSAEKLRSGFEMRSIDCEVVYAYIDDMVRWVRTDTGQVAYERRMRADERQEQLPLEDL